MKKLNDLEYLKLNKYQRFVHMCDYIVSRNFMNIEYDKNENIIEERG